MSGNIPVTTTVFESGLQSKINAVNSSTPIEDIIALVRAGELIDTIDNSAIATELQLRLDAVDGSTTPEQYIELAAAYGKVANEIKDIVSDNGEFKITGEYAGQQTHSLSASTPLTISPSQGKKIRLVGLVGSNIFVSLSVGGNLIINNKRLALGANNTGDFHILNSPMDDQSKSGSVGGLSYIQGGTNEDIVITTTNTTAATIYYAFLEGE